MTTRDPAKTRQDLLLAAFEEIHQTGFQKASLDAILARTGVTKGALYHHFPNKKALGYAVVDELIREWFLDLWVRPLEQGGDPIGAFQAALVQVVEAATPDMVSRGCPLNNLSQEMSQVDEGFRIRIQRINDDWIDAYAKALEQGQRDGFIREDIDPQKIASFIVASFEGSAGAAKNAQSHEVFATHMDTLSSYLETLRPPQETPTRTAA